MTRLVDRANEDQPWVTATSARTAGGADQDRVYIGHNDFNLNSQTASVELSQDARTAAAPAGFATHVVERGTTGGQDGPAVRIAVHPDGTVYAVFQRWTNITTVVANDVFNVHADIVVVRDDGWAARADPFSALTDPGDPGHLNASVRVATDRFIRFTMRSGPCPPVAVSIDPFFVHWSPGGQLWHNDQQDPALGGAWTGWNFLSVEGNRATSLVVVPNADGRLHTFMIE